MWDDNNTKSPKYTVRVRTVLKGDAKTEWSNWKHLCRPPATGGGSTNENGDTPPTHPGCSGGTTGGQTEEPIAEIGWGDPQFAVNAETDPPRIEWREFPNATGYTAEFTRPINWTGRKDNGYAEMHDTEAEYTVRVKAHFDDGGETLWTDWFNTCRPPYVHAGAPDEAPDCVEQPATGEGGETEPEEPVVELPVADAGSDSEVRPGDTATIGTDIKALDHWDYVWSQTRGPTVELSGNDQPQVSFTVPEDVADGVEFAFDLTVINDDEDEAVDSVTVTVDRPASGCRTELGSFGVGGSYVGGTEYWDNDDCRAHHRTDRAARYFRFETTERATLETAVSRLDEAGGALLFVSRGEPQNGWGTRPKGNMAHRLRVRRENGKLVHEEDLAASVALWPDTYTAEVVLDSHDDAQRVASFSLGMYLSAAPPLVSVADARVDEGPGAKLSFSVTLDDAAPAVAGVDWATADGTALAGSDYAAASGTVTFQPGETEKTVTVDVLDDAVDEGEETMTVTLSEPDGIMLDDAEATGTIANGDPIPAGWLVRFARAATDHAVDAVEGRLARTERASSLSVSDLMGRSFHYAREGGNLAAWARGAESFFAGVDGGVAVDGRVSTTTLGVDAAHGRWLAGLALARSSGHGTFSAAGRGRGTLSSTVTVVHPYAHVQAGENASAWGMLGYGTGDMLLAVDGGGSWRADTVVRMAAAGGRASFLRGDGFELAVKSDARLTGAASSEAANEFGNLAAVSGDAGRLRLALEASGSLPLGPSTLLPSVEVGLRHDTGDVETGTGIELGASLGYADPARGLSVDIAGRTLAAHADDGYREWGVGASLTLDPEPVGRGLALSLAPSWGVQSAGGVERLWSARDARGMAGYGADDGMRFEVDIAWAADAFGGRGTATPYLGTTSSGYGDDWRLGTRWSLGPSLSFAVEGTRRTWFDGRPDHGLLLTLSGGSGQGFGRAMPDTLADARTCRHGRHRGRSTTASSFEVVAGACR